MAIVKEIPVTDPVCGKNTVALDEHAVRRMKERKITEAQVMKKHEFLPKLDISVDEKTGQIRAAYLQIREGTVHKTREISAGNAFADYDRSGWLLGIELLGPCEATVLDKLAKNEPKRIKRFLLGSPPRELVTT